MPYVRVHIDADDVLDELSDECLEKELDRRREKRGLGKYSQTIPAIEAAQVLDEVATMLRRAGQIALAYKVDEARHDYIVPKLKADSFYRWKTGAAAAVVS